ncbi:MAG: hypothetical protein HRT81_12785 [Henriciella sp.]|nr:hypothetical protein [Henriciella sp.]
MTKHTDEIYDLKPRRHPERGPVFRLVFDYIASDEAGNKLAEVFIHPKRYPKQLNPNWRVDVEMVGASHYGLDIDHIRRESVVSVFERWKAWLERVAPDASPLTITWQELVRLTLSGHTKYPTPYKTRKELKRQRRLEYPPKYRYRETNLKRYPKRHALSIDID